MYVVEDPLVKLTAFRHVIAVAIYLLLGVTMDTRSTVICSNQLISGSGVGKLL